MTLLDRILGRTPGLGGTITGPIATGNTVELQPGQNVSFLDMVGMSTRTDASVKVTEHSSLGMAAVWRAVNLIASGAASLPLHAYKPVSVPGRDLPVRQLQLSGQAATLLSKPHPDMTPFELWEVVYAHIALWGNAFLLKLRDQSGVVTELWPIHPAQVHVGRASDGTKVYQINGGPDSFGDDRILHIPGFGYDGIAGLSPIALARQGIGLALAAEKFGARLFGSGSLAGGILTTEQRLNQGQADALKERWKSKISGVDNSHEVAILDAGAKFQQLTIPPEDAQFLESRSFQVEEVARIFGIPPHMLMANDKTTSWGAGIEQQTIAFVTYTLRPWLTRVEQRISTVLTPNSIYARYALEGLLRGDSAQRGAFYNSMFSIGALTTNEIRALEELPPVDGGDIHYRPLNYGQLGTSDATEVQPQ